jgi:fluoride exporter
MKSIILVMAGGAIGSALRYGLSRALPVVGSGWASGWPVATFAANILGGFAMGLLTAYLWRVEALWPAGAIAEDLRLLLGVGLLGGFTTFSAFSLELMKMIEQGQGVQAALYATASVVIALLAVFAGAGIGRGVWA